MTIAEALKKYKAIEADLLLEHVLKQSKEFLYLNSNKSLTKKQQTDFESLAKKRLKDIPIAYLVGYKYFYGLKFDVNKDVLIPRPESEWLVESALSIASAKLRKNTEVKILDMATGSGCIAISIKKNLPSTKVKVFASDVSAKALTVAKKNAKSNKVSVKFTKSNLFKDIKDEFDVIIANLPYVPERDYKKLLKNLKHEPKLALTDGGNDFKLINKFLDQAPKHLKNRGVVLIESDPKFFKKTPLHWRIVKDIHGLNRFALMKNYVQ